MNKFLSTSRVSSRNKRSATGILAKHPGLVKIAMLLCMAIFTSASIVGMYPPKAVPVAAPQTEFSSGRAMIHLRHISQQAHPLGSAEHDRVRDYILTELTTLGANPEVQSSPVQDSDLTTVPQPLIVQNIVARVKGRGDRAKTVLLSAHYDTVANSPGANDNSSGVAVLLETLRALKSSPPLINDVIFLFTDGEEIGLLGARVFIKEHRWARDVGIALNFDSRGSRGPVFMFETSDHNGWLIQKFAQGTRKSIASSYMPYIYRIMPHATDLTIFTRSGLQGLNFAHIAGGHVYHSIYDSHQNIDERSLQHHGLLAYDLTREFGDSDLDGRNSGEDTVYFDILGRLLMHYPFQLVHPLAVIVTALFSMVVVLGFKNRHLTITGLILGFIAPLLCLACFVTLYAFIKILARGSFSTLLAAANSSSRLPILGSAVLAATICLGIHLWFKRRVNASDLTLGGLLFWLLLMNITALYLPGANHLFTWPLLFSLFPIGYLVASKNRGEQYNESPGFIALLCVCAMPGIFLFVPLTCALYFAMGLSSPAILMAPQILLITSLFPQLNIMTIGKK